VVSAAQARGKPTYRPRSNPDQTGKEVWLKVVVGARVARLGDEPARFSSDVFPISVQAITI
jgi:hypothetical protein